MFGGFLGPRYNPVALEFAGAGNNPRTFRPNDPHGGVRAADRFQIMDTALHGEMTLDRLNRRVQLVEQFDAQRRRLDSSPAFDAAVRGRQMALGVTASSRLRDALDLAQEPLRIRERYG